MLTRNSGQTHGHRRGWGGGLRDVAHTPHVQQTASGICRVTQGTAPGSVTSWRGGEGWDGEGAQDGNMWTPTAAPYDAWHR